MGESPAKVCNHETLRALVYRGVMYNCGQLCAMRARFCIVWHKRVRLIQKFT